MFVFGSVVILVVMNLQYKSRYEGDLVAKCYFAKHKLVWEVLDGCLKNKIEIPWSDIMALKAKYPEDGPGTLEIVVSISLSCWTRGEPKKWRDLEVLTSFHIIFSLLVVYLASY